MTQNVAITNRRRTSQDKTRRSYPIEELILLYGRGVVEKCDTDQKIIQSKYGNK